jgi:hypothetical protein
VVRLLARAATTAQRAAPATESTRRAAASIRSATQVSERRAPAGANRNDNDPAAPNQAAVADRAEQASSRSEAAAAEAPHPAKMTTERPSASREHKPVTPPRADRRMTPLKPPKDNAKLAPT